MTEKKEFWGGVPDGYDIFVLAQKAHTFKKVLYIASSEQELVIAEQLLMQIDSDINVLSFPAWDTIPYDRVSPHADIESRRVATLSELSVGQKDVKPLVILTTVPALMQKVPPASFFRGQTLHLQKGESFSLTDLNDFFQRNGYRRTDQVSVCGEYALRGGIIDVFPAGQACPVRLDFFGDDLEELRLFDAQTQKTIQNVDSVDFKPMSEFRLTPESIALFRSRYLKNFGSPENDLIYESVSNGRKVMGLEHWLPFFFEQMSTFFDYLPLDTSILMNERLKTAFDDYEVEIQSYYNARVEALKNPSDLAGVYHPVSPESFFLEADEVRERLSAFPLKIFSAFVKPNQVDLGGRVVQNFKASRVEGEVFENLKQFIDDKKGKVVIAAFSDISADRILEGLREKNVTVRYSKTWKKAIEWQPSVVVVPIEKGFASPHLTVLTEADILGEKISRPSRHRRTKENFIEDISTLSIGDLVVHINHGIGRYEGLVTVQAGGLVHDCLQIIYDGGDKLFVPVENLDVLTRYGSENTAVSLDKLGGDNWQARKSRLKKHLLEMAEKLIGIAAQRFATKTEKIVPDLGSYNEFCARFPYTETEDQLSSIGDVIQDFEAGCPMDRLVCGDVGFGKTEVALRAAFLAAMNGLQVAVVVPTTLLARQHYDTFVKRFDGFPLKVGQLSRLVSEKEKKRVRESLADGTLDIVVGTHALLSKTIQFRNLGLLIVDEEQHFGVAHKEQLKALRSSVHVLTLTATPIPRTLQMSLTGVRDLSIIATPPVDRLAVSTFVMPFDSVIIREAILREKMRGGQTFYVCPRISDMNTLLEQLKKIVPEAKIVTAHGQMAPSELEKIMTDFADKKYDVLLATSIIESGLDMASVNTIIIHRADMFGLAALYQLRGRVGRSKLKAYAYLTTTADKVLTEGAQKRLSVMQSLDSLGAGFTLASHDLDIRGAGNLLGEEQSGHIKEVGVELYQKMLEEAVATLKSSEGHAEIKAEEIWSPQISLGLSVLIPESYVPDLGLRMELYHRLANITDEKEWQDMHLEMEDRFGPLPAEVLNLFEIVRMKAVCRQAHIERVDVGQKGMTIVFHNNVFPNPAGLVAFINSQTGLAKLKPDKLTITRVWPRADERLNGAKKLIEMFARMAKEGL